MKKKKTKLPDFDKMSLEEEAKWWDTHDVGDYWDEFDNVKVIVDLDQPRDDTLVLRIQKKIKEKLEKVARSKGLNVSTLARMWLIEKLRQA